MISIVFSSWLVLTYALKAGVALPARCAGGTAGGLGSTYGVGVRRRKFGGDPCKEDYRTSEGHNARTEAARGCCPYPCVCVPLLGTLVL